MWNKTKSKLPKCIAFVDFEHWYISLDRFFSVKPDVKGWYEDMRRAYDVEEVAVFADFSNTALRAELDKLRDITNIIIDTKNSSEFYKKDFTDFIMLDYIYQSAMVQKKVDTFVIFTGDGHFNSVVRFIRNQCRKNVGIYGITGAVSTQLRASASWCKEIPSDTEVYRSYYKMIVDTFNYLTVHRLFEEDSSLDKIIERTSKANKVKASDIKSALSKMLDEGYVYKAAALDKSGKKLQIMKPNWELLARDGLWARP